jgi:hypothetical protein
VNRAIRITLGSVVVVVLVACSGSGSSSHPATTPTPPATSASTSTSGAAPATYTSPPATLPVSDVPLTTDPPPWLAPAVLDNGADSARYVTAAGLPYAEEMLQVHYHAHLDVEVNGKPVTVPLGVGFIVQGTSVTALAPLHTHDATGIVHIENSVPATFVLGQFFIEWGVRFTPTCLAGYCTGQGKELAVFVNGTRYAGDPTRLVLAKHQEIAIEYGDAGKLPPPPSSYAFPNGL